MASAVFILQSEEAEIVVFESHVDTQGGGTRTTKQGSHCFSVYAETTESSESTLDESAFTLNLSDGEWHTFGVEWWGDGDNNGLRFYVDGVLTMESASDSSVDGNTGCIHASAMKASMMVELGNAPLDEQDGDILKVKSYHRWTPAKYGPEPYVHLSKAQVESRHSNDAFLPWHRGAQAEGEGGGEREGVGAGRAETILYPSIHPCNDLYMLANVHTPKHIVTHVSELDPPALTVRWSRGWKMAEILTFTVRVRCLVPSPFESVACIHVSLHFHHDVVLKIPNEVVNLQYRQKWLH